MQIHDDFIFHLDEPLEDFTKGSKKLRGWIAAQNQVHDIRLRGATERPLTLEERPDVRRAFPNFPFAIGYVGEVGPKDVRSDSLHFSFATAGTTRHAAEFLGTPPSPAAWPARVVASIRWGIARAALRLARTPAARWSAAVAAYVREIEIARRGLFRRLEADRLIDLFAEHFPDAFVLQIGASDGVVGDPLVGGFEKTRWRGILVEPVPYLCEALRQRYADRAGIEVVQAAVSAQDGEARLYRLRDIPGHTPAWFAHLGSLDLAVLEKHRASIPDFDALLVAETTPTVRLQTLLDRYSVTQVDLLVVDTEGHDFEILREVDFTRVRPVVLMFEHQHLSAADKHAAYRLLKANGYDCRETPEGDAIAWRSF